MARRAAWGSVEEMARATHTSPNFLLGFTDEITYTHGGE